VVFANALDIRRLGFEPGQEGGSDALWSTVIERRVECLSLLLDFDVRWAGRCLLIPKPTRWWRSIAMVRAALRSIEVQHCRAPPGQPVADQHQAGRVMLSAALPPFGFSRALLGPCCGADILAPFE